MSRLVKFFNERALAPGTDVARGACARARFLLQSLRIWRQLLRLA